MQAAACMDLKKTLNLCREKTLSLGLGQEEQYKKSMSDGVKMTNS